jgi:hypothetical protein
MSVRYARGDIFLTRAHALAIGINATGRLGVAPETTALQDRYPVFVSDCHKRGRAGTLAPGTAWVWREGQPWVVGLVVRETPLGATRLRYVETAILNLCRDWEREGLRSLALLRLGEDAEWSEAREIAIRYLDPLVLPVIIYEEYLPGVVAEPPDEK